MIAFALLCVVVHFWFGWQAAIDEAATHDQSATMDEYVIEWVRDTFENLQSEFWQLAVQFALLAGFFEFLRVRAHEEDQEELKQRLSRIEAILRDQAGQSRQS
jgi:hypothetical protein